MLTIHQWGSPLANSELEPYSLSLDGDPRLLDRLYTGNKNDLIERPKRRHPRWYQFMAKPEPRPPGAIDFLAIRAKLARYTQVQSA